MAATILALLTACRGEQDVPPLGPSGSSDIERTEEVPRSPASEDPETEAAIAETVRRYFTTVDQVRQDAEKPESDLDAVASSTQLTAQKRLLKNQRGSGRRQVGDTRLVELSIESVFLDKPVTAYVDVCWDVSGVDIIDADGKSVVTDGRKDVGWTRLTVTNPAWETAPTDGWRVSSGSDLEREPCAAS